MDNCRDVCAVSLLEARKTGRGRWLCEAWSLCRGVVVVCVAQHHQITLEVVLIQIQVPTEIMEALRDSPGRGTGGGTTVGPERAVRGRWERWGSIDSRWGSFEKEK